MQLHLHPVRLPMETRWSSGLDIWGAPPPVPTSLVSILPLPCLSFRVIRSEPGTVLAL